MSSTGESDLSFLEPLRQAWAIAPPEPPIGPFLRAAAANPVHALGLLRFDALERRRRGLPWDLRHYCSAAPEHTSPGSPSTRFLIGLELALEQVTPERLKERLAPTYAPDVDWAAAQRHQADDRDSHEGHFAAGRLDAAPDDGFCAIHGQPCRHVLGHSKGDRIGSYTLRKPLGHGGFGEVWLASRRDPDMTVAIQVLNAGAADKQGKARFEAEAQALALLDHECIAGIHEAGLSAAGEPYIAMEYVEGEKITRYCDRRSLSLAQRLELMARVCDAVHHAHARQLLHRDLKPDNILVTEIKCDPKSLKGRQRLLQVGTEGSLAIVARPKIVDFGLAKALSPNVRLTDQTLTVDLGKLMGTLEYMAPEQTRHDPLAVDTRADIFALGVVLYESIAGVLPLPRDELARCAINEAVAKVWSLPRPTLSARFSSLDASSAETVADSRRLTADRLSQTLHGRIRHLPGTALRLDKERRFSSAAAFARDLRHYLDDEPFEEAAAEPLSRKAWLAVRRNPLPYAAAITLLVALVAGIAGTTWAWHLAAQQREFARENEEKARAEKARADAARDEAERLRTAAEVRGWESHKRLVRIFVDRAWQSWDAGRSTEGLLYAVEALRTVETYDDLPGEAPVTSSLTTERAQLARRLRTTVAAMSDQIPKLESFFYQRNAQVIALCPDGQHVATYDWHECQIWDLVTGSAVTSLAGFSPFKFPTGRFSPDGKRLLIDPGLMGPQVWDVRTGKLILPVPGKPMDGHEVPSNGDGDAVSEEYFVESYGFPDRAVSPDNRVSIRIRGNEAQLSDVKTGQLILPPIRDIKPLKRAIFSSDGQKILTVREDCLARVWSTFPAHPLTALLELGSTEDNGFGPDGRTVITASQDGLVRRWELQPDNAVELESPGKEGEWHPLFSPDANRLILTAGNGTSRIWDLMTGKPITPPMPHGGPISRTLFSPDGRRVLTIGGHVARLWDAHTGQRVMWRSMLDDEPLNDINYVVDLPLVSRGEATTTLPATRFSASAIEDVAQYKTVLIIPEGADVLDASFSPDGKHLITGNTFRTRLWDATSGRLEDEFSCAISNLIHSKILCFPELTDSGQASKKIPIAETLSTDETVLTVIDGIVQVYTGSDYRVDFQIRQPSQKVASDFFSADVSRMREASCVRHARVGPHGHLLVTAGENEARIWDAQTGDPVTGWIEHPDTVLEASFSPSGKSILTTCNDGTARLWDSKTGEPIAPPLHNGKSLIGAVFSPDGLSVATFGGDQARVWDVQTGQPVTPPLEHLGPIGAACFSPDGSSLMLGCVDGSVQRVNLRPDGRRLDHLTAVAQFLAGATVSQSTTLRAIPPAQLRETWPAVRGLFR